VETALKNVGAADKVLTMEVVVEKNPFTEVAVVENAKCRLIQQHRQYSMMTT
jgi:hypothetical protein